MISLKAVENLLGFSYPTIPAISAIDIFVVTKSWVAAAFYIHVEMRGLVSRRPP